MADGKNWIDQISIKVNGSPLQLETMNDIIELTIDSSLHLPDMFILHIHDDEFKWLDQGPFDVGAPVVIELPQDDRTDTTIKVFAGEITAVEPSFSRNLTTNFTVRGYDHSHRLNRGTKTRAFVNITDSDIVQQIASEAGLTPQIESTSEVYDHVYQHNLTDMQFLYDRAQRIGFEVFVDDEKKLYFRKPEGGRGNVDLEWGVEMRSFRPRLTAFRQVGKVTVKGWNPDEKKEIIGEAASSQTAPEINVGGTGIQIAGKFNDAEEMVVRRPVWTQREADTIAQALLDEINSGFVEAEGVAIGNPQLLAGKKVNITKIGNRFSGTYVVTGARHIYAQEGYETHFTVQGARPRLMTDLLQDQSVFDSDERFWGGVVPAIVTNINDPDSKGRVKLQYPWMDTKLESGWARVSALGAGNERGFLWLPEVQDEVLVAFEHGDFNRPYVVGGLWNGKDEPPEPFTEASNHNKSEVRIMKSRIGHYIKMVDGPGDKYIEIVDAENGTAIKLDAKEKTLEIKTGSHITIKNQGNIQVETSGGNLDISSTANVTIKGNGNVDIEASGVLNLKGATVNIN